MTVIKLEYVWLDGDGKSRSKTKILNNIDISSINNIPEWNYDGSSTNQAIGSYSEVILKPCVIYPDPFRKENNKLILCETYNPDGTPHVSNTRYNAMQIFKKYTEQFSMYGIEQEFFITKNNIPLGLTCENELKHNTNYYCGVGGETSGKCREYMEEVINNCIYSGIQLTGMNAEVSPSQWEIQICDLDINASDQLIISRYIMERTSEKYGWTINYEPKLCNYWNGSGCHVNFSTKQMRDANGYNAIINAIEKLEKKHSNHMNVYGKDNEKRMTGKHETSNYNNFSYGVANRGASIRIPCDTHKNNCGYFEDRRPAANMDPYSVTSLILQTINTN